MARWLDASCRLLRPATGLALAALLLVGTSLAPAHAVEFELRDDGGAIFGKVERIRTRYEDTLIEIARKYSLGYEELMRVNKGVDPWLPGEGTQVVIPGQRLLPPGEREGIVVNLPEHRMYFFRPPDKDARPTVLTFPVSVGKMDWRTPIGVTKVVSKQKNPSWYPPESVRAEHEARGDPLPRVVGPGPSNPLGAHALRLAIPGGSYLIHGTNNPDAVGMAVTHGCLRMYPEDVAVLFDAVKVGTRVTLINEPLKMTKVDGEVWIEAHPPIDEQGQTAAVSLEDFEKRLDQLLGTAEVAINWDIAIQALREASGIPVMIGLELVPQPPPVDPATVAPNDAPIDKPT
jgi:L,D-transpeptidase ErfK/SrfK